MTRRLFYIISSFFISNYFLIHYTNAVLVTRGILAVVLAEKNVSINDVWSNGGGFADANGSYHLLHSTTIFKTGKNFRSYTVKRWSLNTPTTVSVVLYNKQGDVLGSMTFNATGTNSSMKSWFIAGNLLSSTISITPQDAEIHHTKTEFENFVSPIGDPRSAYFGTTNNNAFKVSNSFPIFLLSRSTTKPYPLQTEASSETRKVYEGCWQYASFSQIVKRTIDSTMTIEMCMSMCTTPDLPLTALEMHNNCYCGHFGTKTTRDDSLCDGPCGGDSSQKCGKTPGMFAVYRETVLHIKPPVIPVPHTPLTTYRNTLTTTQTIIEIDLSAYKLSDGSPPYITGVSVSGGNLLQRYQLGYGAGIGLEWAVYSDWDNTAAFFEGNGKFNELTVLQAALIVIFNFADGNAFTDPTLPPVNITLYAPAAESHFIEAPIMAIEATWTQVVPQTATPTVDTVTSSPNQVTTNAVEEQTTGGVTTNINQVTTSSLNQITTASPVTTDEFTTLIADTTTQQQITTTDQLAPVTNQVTSNTNSGSSPVTSSEMTSTCNQLNGAACPCACTCTNSSGFILTPEEIKQKIKELRALLLVNKSKLSSHVRKYISAKDDRPSAQHIGSFGAVILILSVALVMSGDLLNLFMK